MKQKEAAEGRVARQALQEGRGWRDGPGVAASGMERRRHTGVLKVEGTGERMLPRWGLVRVVLPLRSRVRARPPWSMFPGGCFGPGLLCHTHSLNSQNNHFK